MSICEYYKAFVGWVSIRSTQPIYIEFLFVGSRLSTQPTHLFYLSTEGIAAIIFDVITSGVSLALIRMWRSASAYK